MAKHALFICKSCHFYPTQRDYVGERGGWHLLKQLLSLSKNWSLQSEFVIQEVDCLSACKRPCAIAFTALNKTSLMFGDLPPLESANAIQMYCCGVTVYDYCHLDHGRSYIVWDVVRQKRLSSSGKR